MVEFKKQPSSQSAQADEMMNLSPQFFLNILVYSKDRPYQLSQFLESFFKNISTEGLDVHINILYTCTPNTDFNAYYDKLKIRFHKQVRWHLEDGTTDQILKIIKGERPAVKADSELMCYFSFMVDDMIFFRELKLLECVSVLQESSKAYALHLKLSPGIYYSHTNNKIMRLPNFEPVLK